MGLEQYLFLFICHLIVLICIFQLLSVQNGDKMSGGKNPNSHCRLSAVDLHVYNEKIKWDVYTISAEGEKQVCDNMNKICELLMISILMTNHHANQFILWPQIADWC